MSERKRETEPLYPPLSQAARDKIADECLRGQNQNRGSFAAEIRRGDLYGRDGGPRTYWHCLATQHPDYPEGRRGKWKAAPPQDSWETARWEWQDWGPE